MSEPAELVELEMALRTRLARSAAGASVRWEKAEQVERMRLTLSREVQGVTRYLRITPVADLGSEWTFEVLLGEYGHQDSSRDLDGRSGGSQQHVETLVEQWLVEGASWEALER